MIALTPENAIIVTRYADKYIFPHRSVIATPDTFEGVQAIKNFVAIGTPVYFYDISDKIFIDYLSEKGIILDKSAASWENLELRQIKLIK